MGGCSESISQLLVYMCWFKWLKNATSPKQDLCRDKRIREVYVPQFDQLPVDMMTGGDQCGARVVQADLHIGEATENENDVYEKGVLVGTFFCSCLWSPGEDLNILCLKNVNPGLHSMPNLDQVLALIEHYGPTFYFHLDEIYLPSYVPWFFENGALLYKRGEPEGHWVDPSGSNFPQGGRNDGEY
ncbi:putative DNA-directed RNA polymerase [Helianthus annuus]|nr:putative DNA-directed RNA polymerase [Helianthus annuus]